MDSQIFREQFQWSQPIGLKISLYHWKHSYDILGARMLWKPKEARILKNL
jgi:hypothetical protein